MPNANKLYPRKGDINSIYLKNAITDPQLKSGTLPFITTLSMIPAILKRIMFSTTIPSIMTA